MGEMQVIDLVLEAVRKEGAAGRDVVKVAALEDYLGRVRKAMAEQGGDPEEVRLTREHDHQWSQALFHSSIETAQVALKSAILIGGGGLVALMAFASSAWSKLSPIGLDFLAAAILVLAAGVLFCGIAACLAYLIQYNYHEALLKPAKEEVGDKMRLWAIGLVLGAYAGYAVAAVLLWLTMRSFHVIAVFPVG